MTTTSHVSFGKGMDFCCGVLVGFLSEGWGDNTRLTPTIMLPPKCEHCCVFGPFPLQTHLVIFETLYISGREENDD